MKRVKVLEKLVLKKDDRVNVLEEVYIHIANVETKRKTEELKVL